MDRKQTISRSDLFICIEFFMCFFIVLFTINNNYSLVSLCFTLSFIVLVAFLFHILSVYRLTKSESINFALLSIIVTISLIAILHSLSLSLSFSYFKKYFMFCSTVFFLFIVSKVKINRKTVNLIFVLNILTSCLYIYSYFAGNSGYLAGHLSFNFSNPNLAAMWILQTLFYMIMALLYYRSNIMRGLCIVLIVSLSVFLYYTYARNCLIALFCFAILALYIFLKRNIKISKFLVAILVLLPIIFALVYFVLIRNGDIQAFDFIQLEGKGLYSRQSIWTYAFDMINAHPISGAYYQISGGTGMSQLHNTHIDVWASYGTVVFVLLMIYMTRICIGISARCISKFQTVALLAFLSVIVMGTGEAALFSGGQGIYILSCSLLLLARHLDWDNVKK